MVVEMDVGNAPDVEVVEVLPRYLLPWFAVWKKFVNAAADRKVGVFVSAVQAYKCKPGERVQAALKAALAAPEEFVENVPE